MYSHIPITWIQYLTIFPPICFTYLFLFSLQNYFKANPRHHVFIYAGPEKSPETENLHP